MDRCMAEFQERSEGAKLYRWAIENILSNAFLSDSSFFLLIEILDGIVEENNWANDYLDSWPAAGGW